ncbi:TetR/AcrR family transcriptional regulator [Acetivibrio ethanolgignens]|uniref:TetR family transcriptional regulator n=1 Tax=Acetivibrio ethanolgignens TaxID=290052 RepID=A0A0V8QCY8_9FIRM|nr:TetR/AcrR family transcriptional regulator [Acetivibrio ethanolgignens]KSV58346.1 TetR family transcriptional regulator [Acetivibrio ethanolgignens]
MGKIEEKKQKKQETLLQSAFDIFTTKGLQKASISDIVEKAGVAKGTFYLYFKDKLDICNYLIATKSSTLFLNAHKALLNTVLTNLDDKIIFIIDHIIDQLEKDKTLLRFISKNLSWGVFKAALINPKLSSEFNFYELYLDMIANSEENFKNPEILLFMIIELIGSTIHDSILNNQPVPIKELKPCLYDAVRAIIRFQSQHGSTQ